MHRYDQWRVPVKVMNPPNALFVLTIGHSTYSYELFLALLRNANVTAIADVRSSPYSRHLPQFNRDTLRDDLRIDGIAYVFLGDQLGGGRRTRNSIAMVWRTTKRWLRLTNFMRASNASSKA